MDFSWVTRQDQREVNHAVMNKDFHNRRFAGVRVKLLEKHFLDKFFAYREWSHEQDLQATLSDFEKLKVLKEEESNESSSHQNGEGETKKAKTGSESDVKPNGEDGDDASDTSFEHKPELEAEPVPEPESVSNSAFDSPLITSKDAAAEKDHSQVYPEGKQMQLLNDHCEQENKHDQEVKTAVEKRKLGNEEFDNLSADRNGEGETEKAKDGLGNHIKWNNDDEGDASSVTSSEQKPKPVSESISNSAVDFSLVTSKDKLNMCVAVPEQGSQSYSEEKRVQLLNYYCEQEKAASGDHIKSNDDDEGDAFSNARTEPEPEPEPVSNSAIDSSLVTFNDKLNVCDAVPKENYSQLYLEIQLVQLLDPDCTQKFDYVREVKAAVKKRKLEGKVTGNEAKRFKTSSESDVESDGRDDGDVSSDTSSEHKPKVEPEPMQEHDPKPISNSVMDFSWVTANEESDVYDAIAGKDYSNLYLKGPRVQLLEKLFENRWLKYFEWKRDRDFERELAIDLDLDFEKEYGKYRETEAPVGKKTCEVPAGSDAKKANIAAWYDMSSSEDEEDDDEEESRMDIDQPSSSITSFIEVTSVAPEAQSTIDAPSTYSIQDNTDDNLNDKENEDQRSNNQVVVNKETRFF